MEEGQMILIDDLKALMKEVEDGEFGDFSNNKYPAPKVALAGKFELKALMKEVEDGEFGDFSNNKYPAPKVALAGKFEELRANVINGKYD